LHQDVCEELVKFSRMGPMGEGTDEKVLLGPIQNRKQLDIVGELVEDATGKGRLLIGDAMQKGRAGRKSAISIR